MKLPNWFKVIWWILLLVVLTYFLSQRYNSFVEGTATPMDIFLFLIWVALLLVPLFQEVSFFGVKLKKEIDSLKSDVKEQITNLRSEIQNSIDIRTQIITTPPPPDSRLPELEERFKQIMEDTLRIQGVQRPVDVPEQIDVPEDVSFLFSVRYGIERELRRIWEQRFDRRPVRTISQIVSLLAESELIDPRLANVIRDVYAVCSEAVHANQVTDNQVSFVRDIAPKLMASLRAMQ